MDQTFNTLKSKMVEFRLGVRTGEEANVIL